MMYTVKRIDEDLDFGCEEMSVAISELKLAGEKVLKG